MLIQGTSITVKYKKIEGIKKTYYMNEDLLKKHFNEALVLPIPDDAPEDIPRIIIKTLNEHAQFNISPVAATFEVHYDSGFERDWKRCSEYIVTKMKIVFEFLNILTDNSYEYIGIVTRVLYDKIKQEGAKKISDTLLNASNISNLYDINIKYTFVEKDSMFVNIMLQNARLYKKGIDFNKPGSLNKSEQLNESIGVSIDINDRYGFNTNALYKSSSDKLTDIMSLMRKVMDDKLQGLIERGEY